MIMFRLAVIAALATIVAGHKVRTKPAVSFLRALEFKRTLRLCNAYPLKDKLDVFRGDDRMEVGSLAYQECQEFSDPVKAVKEGDRLEFRVAGRSLGTFTISELPESDSTLLLVVHRKMVSTEAVEFTSHMFAPSKQAQVAVLDVYKGNEKGQPTIMKGDSVEKLVFGTVMSVNSGAYKVALKSDFDTKESVTDFGVKDGVDYVIMRTGVAGSDPKYRQQLVVYPKDKVAEEVKVTKEDAKPTKSGAASIAPVSLALAFAFTALQC